MSGKFESLYPKIEHLIQLDAHLFPCNDDKSPVYGCKWKDEPLTTEDYKRRLADPKATRIGFWPKSLSTVVFDIDTDTEEANRLAKELLLSKFGAPYFRCNTTKPNREHFYYLLKDGVDAPNDKWKYGDTRGTGGYVCAHDIEGLYAVFETSLPSDGFEAIDPTPIYVKEEPKPKPKTEPKASQGATTCQPVSTQLYAAQCQYVEEHLDRLDMAVDYDTWVERLGACKASGYFTLEEAEAKLCTTTDETTKEGKQNMKTIRHTWGKWEPPAEKDPTKMFRLIVESGGDPFSTWLRQKAEGTGDAKWGKLYQELKPASPSVDTPTTSFADLLKNAAHLEGTVTRIEDLRPALGEKLARFFPRRGKVSIVAGAPGSGKSVFVAHDVAELTRSGLKVVWLNDDQDEGDVRSMVEEVGADTDNIRYVDFRRKTRLQCVADIDAAVQDMGGVDAFVVDTLFSFCSLMHNQPLKPAHQQDMNEFQRDHALAAMQNLESMGETYNAAIATTVHNVKNIDSMMEIPGHRQWNGQADASYVVITTDRMRGADPEVRNALKLEDEGTRYVQELKRRNLSAEESLYGKWFVRWDKKTKIMHVEDARPKLVDDLKDTQKQMTAELHKQEIMDDIAKFQTDPDKSTAATAIAARVLNGTNRPRVKMLIRELLADELITKSSKPGQRTQLIIAPID